jgi:hypothetical protein
VHLAPAEASYRLVLARACLRAERWSAVVSALEGTPEIGGALASFLLSTAHARLGHDEDARRHHREGVVRMEAPGDAAADGTEDARLLRAQRAEVERLLGLLPK